MTHRAKAILIESIAVYKVASNQKKQKLKEHVNKNLQSHYNGINAIGIGLDGDMVTAGEIFNKIYK